MLNSQKEHLKSHLTHDFGLLNIWSFFHSESPWHLIVKYKHDQRVFKIFRPCFYLEPSPCFTYHLAPGIASTMRMRVDWTGLWSGTIGGKWMKNGTGAVENIVERWPPHDFTKRAPGPWKVGQKYLSQTVPVFAMHSAWEARLEDKQERELKTFFVVLQWYIKILCWNSSIQNDSVRNHSLAYHLSFPFSWRHPQ